MVKPTAKTAASSVTRSLDMAWRKYRGSRERGCAPRALLGALRIFACFLHHLRCAKITAPAPASGGRCIAAHFPCASGVARDHFSATSYRRTQHHGGGREPWGSLGVTGLSC